MGTISLWLLKLAGSEVVGGLAPVLPSWILGKPLNGLIREVEVRVPGRKILLANSTGIVH